MKTNEQTAGTRLARNGQYVPTLNGKDISPTSFDETRALEIAQKAGAVAHTPTPWRIEASERSLTVGTDSADIYIRTWPHARDRADAALILRAVNSHAALIRLLEKTERANAIQHSGGKVSADDWAELYQLANEARASL